VKQFSNIFSSFDRPIFGMRCRAGDSPLLPCYKNHELVQREGEREREEREREHTS
jgi:hypothetical protein